jgi:hypothetical protein
MSENTSFHFLKIAGHGCMMPAPYLLIFSLKKREDKTNVLFWQMFFFFPSKVAKTQDFKGFRSPNLEKIFKILRIHQILA